MNEQASAGRRTLYQRRPLRSALLGTSVLTKNVIAATQRLAPSSFVVSSPEWGRGRCGV